MNDKNNLISQSEFARREGVNYSHITRLKQRGLLVIRQGKVDYAASKKLIDDNADPSSAKFSKDGDNPHITFSEARTAKEAARAKLAQIEVGEKEGALIDAEILRSKLAALFTDIKTRVRAIAPKCAQEIARMKITGTDEREISVAVQKILGKEHDEALLELSIWKL